jgi:hypothetical protein
MNPHRHSDGLTMDEFDRQYAYAMQQGITISVVIRNLITEHVPANGWMVEEATPVVRRDEPWW